MDDWSMSSMAEAVRDAIASTITTLPGQLRRSLTWDQGTEMAQHAQLRIDTGLEIYFGHPHSPWQRDKNEKTNGLLRQYFPLGHRPRPPQPRRPGRRPAALNGRPARHSAGGPPPRRWTNSYAPANKGNLATTP
jgi:IS30 family transposase